MRVLLISGSTRSGSSNTYALDRLHELDHSGITSELYDGLTTLPAFIPAQDPTPPAVADLLERIAAADAVVFSTPEYAGGLPGVLKNLLDWTVGGGELYGKPVAWLDVANPGRGEGARSQLRTVLDYVGARVVDGACHHLTLDRAEPDASHTSALTAALSSVQMALAAALEEDRHVADH